MSQRAAILLISPGSMQKLPRWLAARISAGVYSSVRVVSNPIVPAGDSEPSSSSIRVLTQTDWTFEIALFQHRPLRKQIPLRPIERLPLPHDPPLKRLSLNPIDLPIYHYFKGRGQCWPR